MNPPPTDSHHNNSSTLDCLCAGIIVADHICNPVDFLPDAGQLVLTSGMDLTMGGCASNVALNLAKLGVKVGIAGRVGDDFFGSFLCDTFSEAGVRVDYLELSQTQPTSCTLVINVKNQDRRFFHLLGANTEFALSSIDEAALSGVKAVYVGGFCLMPEMTTERVAALFQAARNQGVMTVLDVVTSPTSSDDWQKVKPLMPLTDYFLPNDDEARQISGKETAQEQAEFFHQAGAKTVIITCGEQGACLVSEDLRIHAAAYPVETLVDTTGSGDAFTAGFLRGLLRGDALERCLQAGCAGGMSSVRGAGSTSGLFTGPELDEFLNAHPLTVLEN